MQSQFVTVDGRAIHLLRAGQGRPLLLLHGYSDSAACWQSLIAPLASAHQVIAYDARGHGQSARVRERYTLEDLAVECLGVMDALGLEQAQLIGHSMGAAVAALAARRAPDRIAAVVLEDPPFVEKASANVPDLQAWKAQIEAQQLAPRDTVWDIYRHQLYPTWDEADLQPRIDARQQLDVRVFDLMDWQAALDWQAWAAQVGVRALLLTGDPALGAIVEPAAAARLAALWRGLQHVHVPQAGHHIRCAAFAAYWQALTAFLDAEAAHD